MARFYEAPGWTRNDSYELSDLYIIRPTKGLFRQGFTLWETVACVACITGWLGFIRLFCMMAYAIEHM